ncbi:MAG: pantetheine-phosphate adenylyltransferase [Planctomycetaceae bacterium]|jgi:pantetheine-phosphate adenylyltransferase|nr:pantetheine-phosphate adenylyltransferase [Planctomycetaceae bacterium]
MNTESYATGYDRTVVYPGSFDPITLGHLNVVERISKIFERVIIGIGINHEKRAWFTPEERTVMIERSTAHLPNIEVRLYEGLTVRFAQQCGAKIMVRGVRPITDIPAEITMMMANRQLAPDVETLFLVADGELAHVSSSLIKEIATVADDLVLRRFLPEPIVSAVREHILKYTSHT